MRCDQKVFKLQLLFSLKVLFLSAIGCLSSYHLVHVKFKMFSHRSFFGDRDRDWEASWGTFIFPLSLGISDPAGNRREISCGLVWNGSSCLWVAFCMLRHEVIAWSCMITGRFAENPTIISDKSGF